jgi:osomolarity two-component system sensor histidine kinase NIK1
MRRHRNESPNGHSPAMDEETLIAATAIVRNLAKGSDPTDISKLTLPGPNTATKQAFERELAALQARVNFLSRAAHTTTNLPDTPNEPGWLPSDHDGARQRSLPSRGRNPSLPPLRPPEFLNGKEESDEERVVSGDDLGHVQAYVQKQAEEIQTHKEIIRDVTKRLEASQEQVQRSFSKVEHEDISQLRRELLKHQQANFAFQKALKEIGSVVTAVANGDLSHKILIHKVEMDPEIRVFKETSTSLGLSNLFRGSLASWQTANA